jgi:acyl-CoA synthetase (AMP-forming)/AMP-acid ligase II
MTAHQHTLGDTIINNARWYGDRLAVVGPDRTLTHSEFLSRASHLAGAFAGLGTKHQDRIAILSENSVEYLECYAALELSGHILVTVNYRLAAPEIQHILIDSSPKVFLFTENYADIVADIRDNLTSVEHFICIGRKRDWAMSFEDLFTLPVENFVRPEPDDIAYLIYTSGTTGRPKGCVLGNANQVEAARMTAMHMLLSADDRTLLVMPLYHIGAKNIQLAAHWLGGTVHIHSAFKPEAVLEAVAREKITVLHLAPTMIQMLLDCPDVDQYDLSSVRMVLYSAAPMPLPLLKKGMARLGQVFAQIYGQTEGLGTILNASSHRPDGDARDLRRLISIGHPYQGTWMRVVDDDDHDVPVGQPGELLLHSPIMMRGYWNNHVATAEALRGGWLHSGDIATIDEDGYVYLVDRKKDVIISGGENIYSREVEDALFSHPAVQDVAVVGMPDAKWGEIVTAFIVPLQPHEVDAEALIAHCRIVIAGYKRPRRIEFVGQLPRLASGKVNKRELRELAASRIGQQFST